MKTPRTPNSDDYFYRGRNALGLIGLTLVLAVCGVVYLVMGVFASLAGVALKLWKAK